MANHGQIRQHRSSEATGSVPLLLSTKCAINPVTLHVSKEEKARDNDGLSEQGSPDAHLSLCEDIAVQLVVREGQEYASQHSLAVLASRVEAKGSPQLDHSP